MKNYLTVILAFVTSLSCLLAQGEYIETSAIAEKVSPGMPSDLELNNRLKKLNLCVSNRLTPEVRAYIHGYVERKKDKTEEMLTRTLIYFPVFEKYFNNCDLPKDLRNLAVVESALNPVAISRSGAMGLWQFMPETGSMYGLNISAYTDDRCDPHKATKAAIQLLSDLYKSFGNWELAIAAYNSGPRRITNAMKLARSNDFWRIRKYLPKETQNYVPAYIAANYVLNYYNEHRLERKQPNLDLQITMNTKVFNNVSFAMISTLTALPLEMIKQLNPTFSKDYIPTTSEGSNLILPKRVLSLFKDYLDNPDTKTLPGIDLSTAVANTSPEDPNGFYVKSIYVADKKESFQDLAKLFHCSPENLMAWNNLSNPTVNPGQELTIYLPREMKRLKTGAFNKDGEEAEETDIADLLAESEEKVKAAEKPKNVKKKYLYYQIKRNETLSEIAEKFSGVSLKDLIRINNIKNTRSVRSGKRIKLKEL